MSSRLKLEEWSSFREDRLYFSLKTRDLKEESFKALNDLKSKCIVSFVFFNGKKVNCFQVKIKMLSSFFFQLQKYLKRVNE